MEPDVSHTLEDVLTQVKPVSAVPTVKNLRQPVIIADALVAMN